MCRVVLAYGAALALAAALFTFAPGLDLWAGGLFYRPGHGFFLADWGPVRAIYIGVPYVVDALIIGIPGLALIGWLRGCAVWRIDARVAAYLLLALALGPGLLVNTVLKDHWGRARPEQVTEFGGTRHFTPVLEPADQCARNCSFPAGHPAIGFYFLSFAFLVGGPRRRRLAEAAAVGAGALLGAARMAQGGHFLSDVVFSGLLVGGTSWLLYRALIVHDAAAAFWRMPRLMLLALTTGAATLVSIAAVDRPVAQFFHDTDPALHAVFAAITNFGLSGTYLIAAAALFIALRLAAGAIGRTMLAQSLLLGAYRALFVLIALLASGAAVDLLKVIFGRARPKLLFSEGFYGFTWGGMQADYWSFPSGHTVTIVALATAFFLLWPRGLLIYAIAALLVASSRIVLDAHYVSDVICGAALGAAVSWGVWLAFARAGVSLSEAPALPSPQPRSLGDNP